MQFIAILTYGRTGSTVLQHALNRCPGVLVRGENFNALRGLFSCYSSMKAARERFGPGPRHCSQPWFGSDLWDEEKFLGAQRRLVVDHILKPGADTRVLGFKEIRYEPGAIPGFGELIDYLAYLDRLLPGIRFLVNRRNPDATCASGWWPGVPDGRRRLQTAYEWLGSTGDYLEARLGRRAVVETAYEEWSADPMALRKVWEFLGIAWDPEGVAETLAIRLPH